MQYYGNIETAVAPNMALTTDESDENVFEHIHGDVPFRSLMGASSQEIRLFHEPGRYTERSQQQINNR